MILLVTDGAPKTSSAEAKTLHAIKKEVELFKHEYKNTTFKLLALQLGNDKNSTNFIKKLTQQTVKIRQNLILSVCGGTVA